MKAHTKLAVAALATTLFMALAVGSASARRFQLSEQNFLAAWTSLAFDGGSGAVIHCPVTLDGSFHSRTLSKVSGQLIGHVNQAILGGGGARPPCTGGTATILRETLPWHIRYLRFSGTLPLIELIQIALVGAAFRIQNEIAACLTRTEANHPGVGNIELNSEGRVLGMNALPEFSIPLDAFCEFFAGPGRFSGNATVSSSAGTRPPITIRLVQ